MIGSALATSLQADGHAVTRLVRREARGPEEARWDPQGDTIDAEALEGLDAVVHLAGPSIGGQRWTPEYKRLLRDSRVLGTGLVARTLAGLARPPAVLVSGSAVGYYGDRGDEILTEESSPGTGFLADLVQQWEEAAAPAVQAGIRVVHPRTGIVQSAKGGALERMLLPFKFGIGGRLGSGRQWFSWIALDDEVRALRFLIDDGRLRGPVNLTAPNPVTNGEFTKALGRVLHRPTFMPVPTAALYALLGRQLVDETILAGQRVHPAALEAAGFTWRYADVEPALVRALEQQEG